MDDPIEKLFASLDKRVERAVHPASMDDDALLARCTVHHTRGTGPGGQHRHNNQTAVVLTDGPTGRSAQASERRSAEENKRVALRRLRLVLAVEHREAVPAGEIRSEMWRLRTPGGRIVLSPRHRDYPAMLAEAMDVLEACGLDPKRAALRLGVSPSQLIRMISDHPPALAAVNRARKARGEHELRG
ncbi:MAG: hypothetical protein LAT64_01195 [Phycisphaerales bacterium]|nr:peptide chain release factor-like protein [Planctomycetota bacterium]MCH8507378.1 hypothetical protein [Phycisphaerales bacterium]